MKHANKWSCLRQLPPKAGPALTVVTLMIALLVVIAVTPSCGKSSSKSGSSVPAPGAFTLGGAITDGMISVDRAITNTITWTASANASSYTLEISTDDVFTNTALVLTATGLTLTEYTVPAGTLTADVWHYFRVKAVNATGAM